MDTEAAPDFSAKMIASWRVATYRRACSIPTSSSTSACPPGASRLNAWKTWSGFAKTVTLCQARSPVPHGPDPNGIRAGVEERWEHEGQSWYARQMLRTDITDGRITQLTVYCTGDWDEARRQEFANRMTLVRP